MQALYIILGALAVLIPGLFTASMFLPSTVKVERVRAIPVSPSVVFQQVNVIHNWEGWSPWYQPDATVKLAYNEHQSGIGAGYSWQNRTGHIRKGSFLITESRPDEYIGLTVQFMNHILSKGYFRFEPIAEGTMVTWGIVMELGKYPTSRILGLMMRKWVRKDFERGLENLEKLVK
jgi:hypothetical protein